MATTTATKAARDQLKSFIERIERIEEEKRELGEDVKSVYQEAKAQGFDGKAMRALVRLRRLDSNKRAEQEAILTTYMHALGMAEAPLFAAVGAMAVDPAARDQVIDAFKRIVPQAGEVIIKMGGASVRLWRDKNGNAHAEDYTEPVAPEPVRPGRKLREPAPVFKLVPESDKQPEPEGVA